MPYPWSAAQILTASDLNTAFAALVGTRSWFAKTSGTDQTGITTIVDVTGLSVTWTAESTRTYRLTLSINITKTTDGSAAIYITDASNTVITAKSQQGWSGTVDCVTWSWVETGLSGSQTRKARIETGVGSVAVTNSFSRNGILIIEDIGPT